VVGADDRRLVLRGDRRADASSETTDACLVDWCTALLVAEFWHRDLDASLKVSRISASVKDVDFFPEGRDACMFLELPGSPLLVEEPSSDSLPPLSPGSSMGSIPPPISPSSSVDSILPPLSCALGSLPKLPGRIFLSYRVDTDADLVERMYDKLSSHGIDVWWD
jgi:hypothetical protein